MRDEQIECIEYQDRYTVIPDDGTVRDTVRHSSNEHACDCAHPDTAQYAHVAVFVILVRFVVAAGDPRESAAKEAIFDGGEVGVGLYNHYILDCETVASWVYCQHYPRLDKSNFGEAYLWPKHGTGKDRKERSVAQKQGCST